MTPIATLKTNPTPELITKILTRAAVDGADALVIHLSQTSEDEICFLYLLVPKLSPRPEELERSHLPPFDLFLYANIHFDDGTCYFILKSILKPYETICTNRSKSTRNRRSPEKARSHGAALTYRS